MNELATLQRILPIFQQRPEITTGPGDDCAVINFGNTCLLAAVDQMAAGIHYYPDTKPERIAAKLLTRNLSDIAAMGGTPAYALLSLASKRADDDWFNAFYYGLEQEARRWNVSICGGDLCALPADGLEDVMSLTILGWCQPGNACLRSNAKAGDLLYATGCFGDSLKSGHHLDFAPRLAEGAFLAQGFTSAMIDVSDGLLLDASRIAEASKLALIIDMPTIPLRNDTDTASAMCDGEDYELLFAISPDAAQQLERLWNFETKLTCIGHFESGYGVTSTDGHNLLKEFKTGYEHRNT